MSTTVDTTAILVEELDRLGEPLPLEIASHGSAGIADDVARLLVERGQQHYSAEQWRSALREVFRRLQDDRGDLSERSPRVNVAGDERRESEAAIRGLHEQTLRLLGKPKYSDDEYVSALLHTAEANAEAEANAAVIAAAVNNGLTPEQEERLDGDITVAFAHKLLRDKGIDPETAGYEVFGEALEQAAQVLEDRKVGL